MRPFGRTFLAAGERTYLRSLDAAKHAGGRMYVVPWVAERIDVEPGLL